MPLDRARTQHALVEVEAAGVVMEPGGSPWQRNTRLKILAERVFKRIAPDWANAIAAEVEAGRCTLADLDWLADQTGELGAIKLIFGTTAVADVVLTFLEVSGDIVERVDPVFFSDLMTAAMKALGMTFILMARHGSGGFILQGLANSPSIQRMASSESHSET